MPSILAHFRSPHPLRTLPVLTVLDPIIPPALLQEVVAVHAPSTRRDRALSYELTLQLVIAMALLASTSIRLVLATLLLALRPHAPRLRVVTSGAIVQARRRLGVAPLVDLFHRVCVPLATSTTPGAFYQGLRLMALDTEILDVPDTPANVRVFGRHAGGRGPAAYPQALLAYLVECGTHAIIDVVMGSCHRSAVAAATRLLRRATPRMLLLLDSGLCERPLIHHLLTRTIPFLGRIGTDLLFPPVQGLPDGSYLTRFAPVAPSRQTAGMETVLVRVIVYTLDDPHRPGQNELHRLVTSLLDPIAYPARDLVELYHERWEIELTIDELDTHLLQPQQPVRSKTPHLVIQELYGLLLAHYALRALMLQAAQTQGLDPDRISFVQARHLVVTLLPLLPVVPPRQRAVYRQQLREDLARDCLPPRAQRSNPRVVKRRVVKYRVRRAADQGSQHLRPFSHTIAMITMGAAWPHHPHAA